MADLPHFAFPFTLQNGSIAVTEQDSVEHVMSCENLIVRCPLGFREARPEFGWAFPEFANMPFDLTPLTAALARWEPRGNADAWQWADQAAAAVAHISIDIEVEVQ